MKKLREHLEKYEGSRILDVATGQGTFMSMIASVYDGFVEMTGIDISDKAIAAVEKSFSDPR
ncbi:MAG TPA: class I SAM-dependent methyltransferase, partial [Clostridia bacterium]|nr:class I SAM-dependent methyltransferase [Clostridia bacterium]